MSEASEVTFCSAFVFLFHGARRPVSRGQVNNPTVAEWEWTFHGSRDKLPYLTVSGGHKQTGHKGGQLYRVT